MIFLPPPQGPTLWGIFERVPWSEFWSFWPQICCKMFQLVSTFTSQNFKAIMKVVAKLWKENEKNFEICKSRIPFPPHNDTSIKLQSCITLWVLMEFRPNFVWWLLVLGELISQSFKEIATKLTNFIFCLTLPPPAAIPVSLVGPLWDFISPQPQGFEGCPCAWRNIKAQCTTTPNIIQILKVGRPWWLQTFCDIGIAAGGEVIWYTYIYMIHIYIYIYIY